MGKGYTLQGNGLQEALERFGEEYDTDCIFERDLIDSMGPRIRAEYLSKMYMGGSN